MNIKEFSKRLNESRKISDFVSDVEEKMQTDNFKWDKALDHTLQEKEINPFDMGEDEFDEFIELVEKERKKRKLK